ncbi:MAG: hydrogenase expression/formation protein HypE [Armatimonadota bacterium]
MKDNVILLSHGAGGKKSAELTKSLFLKHFGNSVLDNLGDSAILANSGGKIAFTTDSFVVQPIFFPGGDIGKLAVCGTVNDLTAAGAKPAALSAAFMIEEGFDIDLLESIVQSMSRASEEAGVNIVAGDTKVVPRGSVDKIFITTSGFGYLPEDSEKIAPGPDRAVPGDAVIVSGTIADHGIAVMACREGLRFASEFRSDCAPLFDMVRSVSEVVPDIHCLRDPTRGGLSAVLNELASQSGVCITVDESSIPVNDDVRAACEILGIDPLYVANEGKMVFIVPNEYAQTALSALRLHTYGKDAAVIGVVSDEPNGKVHLRTPMRTLRILDMPSGDLLPRIC